ncbi:RHS repeat protein [Spongiivirga citrea]|uniref:RHS repeat protein n=1 Tax=Spongiivirga citrea TaxID=1481457 RepID=A0A6M0CLR1_9FLAO|nr:RHS repeat domain-containing protein [Spongiivirga citrea]NER16779.1 hypothetical protein [Spongiivirga citrea]
MKIKKIIPLFLLTLVSLSPLLSQTDLPNVIPPSPTVSSLMRFEEVPVDYYTGVPDISIPLMSKQLNGDLQLPLSLRYNTMGLRVDERSGWTGTGWALDAGGTISRTVMDFPDEINFDLGGFTSSNQKAYGVLHNGFFNYDTMTLAEKSEFLYKARGGYEKYDNELDVYQFSILGASGRFVIVKDGISLVPKFLSNTSKVRIELTYDFNTFIIDKFVVIDTRGYKFHFEVFEQTTTEPITMVTLQDGTVSAPSLGSYTYSKFRSAWKMTKITSSNNITLANFSYQDVDENFLTPINQTENKLLSGHQAVFHPVQQVRGYNIGVVKPKYVSSQSSVSIDTKKLSNISFKDQTSILFNISNGHPELSSSGAKLNSLIIKDHNNLESKRFSFYYSTNQYNRLFLDKVSETAGTTTLDYTLEYNSKSNLEGFGSSNKDYWGYLILNQGITYDQTDKTGIKTGALTKITFPTGGSKEFDFESNTFGYEGSNKLDEGQYIANPDNTANINNDSFTFSYDPSNPIFPTSFLSFDHDQTINLSSFVSNDATGIANYFRITLTNGSGFSQEIKLTDQNVDIPVLAGNYSLSMSITEPFIPNTNDTVTAQVSLRYRDLNSGPLKEFLYGGGLRIKQVLFKDFDGSLQRSMDYTYDEGNSNTSSGAIDGFLKNKVRIYQKAYPTYLAIQYDGSLGGNYIGNTIGITYEIIDRSNAVHLQATKGQYIGYKTVTMSEFNKGKTVFTYTSPQDFPSYPPNYGWPFLPIDDIDYKRGNILKTEVYDNTARMLSQNTNNYQYIESDVVASKTLYDIGDCPWSRFYRSYTQYVAKVSDTGDPFSPIVINNCGTLDSNIGFNPHTYTNGRVELMSTTQKSYFYDELGNQSVVEKRQELDYNPENFQQSVVRSFHKENGLDVLYKTELFYPVGGYPTSEFSSSEQQHITKMQSLNMINSPLYTKSYRNTTLLSSVQNIYSEPVSNMIKLSTVKTKKRNDAAEDRVVYHEYDSHGNPLEISKKDGSHVSYVWGHNKTLPIAKIENASYQEIATALGVSLNTLKGYNETNLSTINTLRNSLPKAMISTYVYDPIKGIVSSTDNRGYTMTYSYDDFNRLKEVRDANNKLVTDYEYHYKNE